MPLIQELDYGTPAVTSTKTVTLDVDGQDVTVPEATPSCTPRWGRHRGPQLCATNSLNSLGSCRLCLVEIEGRPGTPGLLHHVRPRPA